MDSVSLLLFSHDPLFGFQGLRCDCLLLKDIMHCSGVLFGFAEERIRVIHPQGAYLEDFLREMDQSTTRSFMVVRVL